MKQWAKLILPLIPIILISLVAAGCGAGKQAIQQEPQPAVDMDLYRELIRQGDEAFAKMHLYGWRSAVESYQKASQMKPSPQLRDKLFLALCLTAIREKREGIINDTVYTAIDSMGEFQMSPRQKYLRGMVRKYRSAPVVRKLGQRIAAPEFTQVDVSAFDLQNSPLDTYLYILLMDHYMYNLKEYSQEMAQLLKTHNIFGLIQKYRESPLFIHFNPMAVKGKEDGVEKAHPDFAEFLLFRGNLLFSKNKLKQAAGYYERILELVPDYPAAINGIGNIYYFTVQDYETAIHHYQKTLELDPHNPVALFGKGVSLHNLERYEESNSVMDILLNNQGEYHGEAYYYKGYNYYEMKDPGTARIFVDKAIKKIGFKGEVFFLSGLLYYNEGRFKEAENEFLRAVRDPRYAQCYPLYYLGLIKAKRQDWSFLRDMRDSVACFESAGRRMERRIHDIDDLEITEKQKQWMKVRQQVKLAEFKESTAKLIAQMQTIIAKNEPKKKKLDREKTQNQLDRVKTVLQRDPTQLNSTNGDGETLLHEATLKGNLEAVKYLLSKGARIDIIDNNGYTPINWAVLTGKFDITRFLLAEGADIHRAGPSGLTMLHDAAYSGWKEIAKMLLAKGARLDVRDENGKTPLDMAIVRKEKELIALLKPLHLAAVKGVKGDRQKLKQLLSKYPTLADSQDEAGRTPLHVAAGAGNNNIAGLLLDNGVDINARDTEGFTPLELARQSGHGHVAQLLVDRGALPNDKEMLAKNLNEKEAVIWYLGGHGWGVKTRNHFLIFDYQPLQFMPLRRPRTPRLANGQLSGDELKDLDVVVFFTSEALNTGRQGAVSQLAGAITNISFVSSGRLSKDPRFNTVGAEETIRVKDVEITSVASTAGGSHLAYMVRVDGLTIYYGGRHGYWLRHFWKPFKASVDYLRDNGAGEGIDMAFLPLPGFGSSMTPGQKEEFAKGTRYLAKTLSPRMVLPIITEGDEYASKQFSKDAPAKGITAKDTKVISPSKRGDRFLYPD